MIAQVQAPPDHRWQRYNQPLWKFGAVAVERSRAVSPALLAEELAASEGVASFSIAPVRN